MNLAENPYLNAFRFHDEKGIPLTVAIAGAGESVNIALFFFDAMISGWNPDSAIETIRIARADNGLPFDEIEFKQKCAKAWTLGGKNWQGAADYIRAAIQRATPAGAKTEEKP